MKELEKRMSDGYLPDEDPFVDSGAGRGEKEVVPETTHSPRSEGEYIQYPNLGWEGTKSQASPSQPSWLSLFAYMGYHFNADVNKSRATDQILILSKGSSFENSSISDQN